MSDPTPQRLNVISRGHVGVAERLCAQMAEHAGFPATTIAELCIVARELATNLVRHTPGGVITLAELERDGERGLEIVAEDRGAGITDLELALTDGYSSDGGAGAGLGAVDRLSDELNICSPVEGSEGARITARRWSASSAVASAEADLDVGVASRACLGQRVNGDAFVVQRWADHLLVAVIDGVGHGQHAHRAAAAARGHLETHVRSPLDRLFRGVAGDCQATRGVVMAVARIDVRAKRIQFASVGNIEVRMLHPTQKADLRVRRGVLGGRAPPAQVTEQPWPESAWLVMHSDGLNSRWRPADHPDLWGGTARNAAHALLSRIARDDDDATVLTVRDARRPGEGR